MINNLEECICNEQNFFYVWILTKFQKKLLLEDIKKKYQRI